MKTRIIAQVNKPRLVCSLSTNCWSPIKFICKRLLWPFMAWKSGYNQAFNTKSSVSQLICSQSSLMARMPYFSMRHMRWKDIALFRFFTTGFTSFLRLSTFGLLVKVNSFFQRNTRRKILHLSSSFGTSQQANMPTQDTLYRPTVESNSSRIGKKRINPNTKKKMVRNQNTT